jgi:predicted enzyme related to lactoylglutathione lyase
VPIRDEPWPHGTPCWIDLFVTDTAAALHFSSSLFGRALDGPPEGSGHLMCSLKGSAVAAISPTPSDNPFPSPWSIYLAAGDLDTIAAKAKKAGGQCMMEPIDVMSPARLAFATDPTGARFGIWQAGPHKGVGVYDEPGALVGTELMTRDYEGAKAFYGDVFGFTYDEMGEGFAYCMIKRSGDDRVVAGLGELGASTPAQVPAGWVIYSLVQDCDASAATALPLRASVLRQPFVTPFGRMATLSNPQGEAFSLIQA